MTYGCTAGVAAMCFYVFLSTQFGALQVLALSLMCAGGIGNVIDRWTYGFAVDFLNIGIGPVRTGIFNVADLALTDWMLSCSSGSTVGEVAQEAYRLNLSIPLLPIRELALGVRQASSDC